MTFFVVFLLFFVFFILLGLQMLLFTRPSVACKHFRQILHILLSSFTRFLKTPNEMIKDELKQVLQECDDEIKSLQV